MSNTKIIKAEINELQECIQVIDYNLGRISMGAREYSEKQQKALKNVHLARIAELEARISGFNRNNDEVNE